MDLFSLFLLTHENNEIKSPRKFMILQYGNKLVNMIETKPLRASSSNLTDIS